MASERSDSAAGDADFKEALRRRAAALEVIVAAGDGRGIVICAGGSRIFTNAYVLIHVLRRTLGCTLPIEMWSFGISEISASMADAIAPFDVKLVDAQPLVEQFGLQITDGWQLKALAVAACGFTEVLLLDADQVPVADPSPVFDWPEYADAGAVFWPDIVHLKASNPIWELLGLVPQETVSIESGQIVINRTRHRQAVALALALNEQSARLFQLIYGDKDTFLMAWKMADAAFALVSHMPFSDERYLIQRDFRGAPLFQHRTNAKWSYAEPQIRLPNFVHDTACLEALNDLRRVWNGIVFSPVARSAGARLLERQLVAGGPFVLESDKGREVIELRSFCEIGTGRTYDRRNWMVIDAASGPVLIFCDRERTTYEFPLLGTGPWTGRRLRLPVIEATLCPSALHECEAAASGHAGLVDQLLRASGFWSTKAVSDDLQAALELLSRVETGVSDRLQQLASECVHGDPDKSAQLRRLAAQTAVNTEGHAPTDRYPPDVLQKGYVLPESE